MEDGKKEILLNYLREPKTASYTYLRMGRTMANLVKKLQFKYGLRSKQEVYELAVLSMGLEINPEQLAPILRAVSRRRSRKSLLKVYEMLLLNEEELFAFRGDGNE